MSAPKPRRTTRLIAIGALAILVPCATALVVVDARRTARRERLEREVLEILRDHRTHRWERPVLRGAPIDGDAHEAQLEAIARVPFRPSWGLKEFSSAITSGADSSAVRGLVTEHADAIAAYRAATRRAWVASGANLARGLSYPDALQHVFANNLLAASALGRMPAECMAIVSDLLRLAQDYAIGAGMGVSLVAMHRVALELALPLASHCLRDADQDTLRSAERELAILARHPPPTRVLLDVDLVRVLVMGLSDVGQTPLVPLSPLGLERWRRASSILDAAEAVLHLRAELQTIGDEYPDVLAHVEMWHRRQEGSGIDLVTSFGSELGVALSEDARARAIVRLLWAAVRLRIDQARAPDDTPPMLKDPELLDPQTRDPFRWISEDGGGRLTTREALEGGRDAVISVRLVWPPTGPGQVD